MPLQSDKAEKERVNDIIIYKEEEDEEEEDEGVN